MRWSQVWLCAWPGLARLWLHGHWRSLCIAVIFAIALNLTLVATLIWPALLGETYPMVAWPALMVVWLVAMLTSLRNVDRWSQVPAISSRVAESRADDSTELGDTLFIRAQREYLKGHWTEAATLLTRELQRNPRDVESRLLLATLMRRRQEWEAAREQLSILLRFDESINWKHEIGREQELIERDQQESLEGSEPASGESVTVNDRQTGDGKSDLTSEPTWDHANTTRAGHSEPANADDEDKNQKSTRRAA